MFPGVGKSGSSAVKEMRLSKDASGAYIVRILGRPTELARFEVFMGPPLEPEWGASCGRGSQTLHRMRKYSPMSASPQSSR